MVFENTYVSNFEGAFRGLRNPLESWKKSDSAFGVDGTEYCDKDFEIADLYCKINNIEIESDHFYKEE